jgi:hypothetical protein
MAALPTLSEESVLFVEEIATTDPYRLFGPMDVYVCRFCLHPKKTRDHAINCEYERAIAIRKLSDTVESEAYD